LTFRDQVREIDDRGLPKFVEKEFEEYLKCGVLAHGFVRVRCERCGEEKIVGFSCKRRGGICSSCNGRKMNEAAALLVDHVIPKVAIRQWVVTVPIFLRYIMARNSVILSKILENIIGVITGSYKKKAKKTYGIRGGLTGNITLIQRFGSALNLNVHFHTVFLEGIYKEGSDKFYRVDAPTDAEVAKIISTIAIRVNRYLKKQGYIKEENEVNTDQLDILERENLLLYELKTPYSDGTTFIQFTPTELIEKLVALVPPPRIHIIRYHGCLAPHSTHRSHIVPRAADEKEDESK
jgi:hypothetical protein